MSKFDTEEPMSDEEFLELFGSSRDFPNLNDICRHCTGTGTEPYTTQPCKMQCDDGFIADQKKSVTRWVSAFIIVNFFDALSTMIGLYSGVVTELNPLMAWAWSVSPLCFALIKMVVPGMLVLRLPHVKNYKHALWAMRAIVALFAAVVIWNISHLMVLWWILKGVVVHG